MNENERFEFELRLTGCGLQVGDQVSLNVNVFLRSLLQVINLSQLGVD